jgi:hypothetical protein
MLIQQQNKQIRGRRRDDPVGRTLLSKTFRAPLQGHTWSIETSSFPSGSDSFLLFRPVLSHDTHRANNI